MEQALVLLWSHDALVGRRCRAEPPAADRSYTLEPSKPTALIEIGKGTQQRFV